MTGKTLNHYRVLEMIGSGGMGEVYAAEDTRLKRRVALKVLPDAVALDPERRRRFEREAQAVAALNHPGIVTIHSVEQAGDISFLTMELVEGETLQRLIGKGDLSVSKILQIAIPLVDAVSAAHQRGIVHRDLKPSNVIVRPDGRVTVLDFGLAKLRDDGGAAGLSTVETWDKTAEGKVLGTVAYMAPEQAEGKTVDERSDIFSLGILLFELATGQRPFKGDSGLSILSAILKDTPVSLTDLRADLPRDLSRIVNRCLAKDPQRRYQSAVDLRNDLEEVRQDVESQLPTGSIAAPAPPPATTGLSRRIAPVIALVAVAGFALYLLLNRDAPSAPVVDTTAASVAAAPPASNRVAVATFDNRSGEASLDSLGRLAAERMIQALAVVPGADTSPTPIVRVSGANGLPTEAVPAPTATSAGGGTLVAGGYYLRGDAIEFQTQILDLSSGRLVHAVRPVSGPRAEVGTVLDELAERVSGAVALRFDPIIDLTHTSFPPTYSAFREYAAGVMLFGKDYAGAMRHYERALKIDPHFFNPRITTAISLVNLERYEEAAAAYAPLVDRRNELSTFERGYVDWFTARLDGKLNEQMSLLQGLTKMAPNDFIVNYLHAAQHLRLNRPAAALETFARLPYPDWVMRYGIAGWRFGLAANARHALGDYDGEVRDANDAIRLDPQSSTYAAVKVRALIAAGRIDEALKAVDELLTLPGTGTALLTAALEFRAHGQPGAAGRIAHRAIAWFETRSPEVAKASATRAGLAQALYVAEQWDRSERIAAALSREFPNNLDYKGLLGTLAARRGRRADAERLSHELRQIERAYLFGQHTFWRARIASVLGEAATAIDLLREATAQGRSFGPDLHRDIDLAPLRDDPAFQEWLRPKRE